MEGDKTADNEKELTSTSSSDMGKLLSTNKEEKNDSNDTLPTSSTDASTSVKSTDLVSDDPISSTSSEMDTSKRATVEKTSANAEHKSSTFETEVELLDMSMSAQPTERIEENVDDLVSDLETLLGEPTGSFNLPFKTTEAKDKTEVKPTIEDTTNLLKDKQENEVSSNTNSSIDKNVTDKEPARLEIARTVEECIQNEESPNVLAAAIDNAGCGDVESGQDSTVKDGAKQPQRFDEESSVKDSTYQPQGVVGSRDFKKSDGDSQNIEEIPFDSSAEVCQGGELNNSENSSEKDSVTNLTVKLTDNTSPKDVEVTKNVDDGNLESTKNIIVQDCCEKINQVSSEDFSGDSITNTKKSDSGIIENVIKTKKTKDEICERDDTVKREESSMEMPKPEQVEEQCMEVGKINEGLKDTMDETNDNVKETFKEVSKVAPELGKSLTENVKDNLESENIEQKDFLQTDKLDTTQSKVNLEADSAISDPHEGKKAVKHTVEDNGGQKEEVVSSPQEEQYNKQEEDPSLDEDMMNSGMDSQGIDLVQGISDVAEDITEPSASKDDRSKAITEKTEIVDSNKVDVTNIDGHEDKQAKETVKIDEEIELEKTDDVSKEARSSEDLTNLQEKQSSVNVSEEPMDVDLSESTDNTQKTKAIECTNVDEKQVELDEAEKCMESTPVEYNKTSGRDEEKIPGNTENSKVASQDFRQAVNTLEAEQAPTTKNLSDSHEGTNEVSCESTYCSAEQEAVKNSSEKPVEGISSESTDIPQTSEDIPETNEPDIPKGIPEEIIISELDSPAPADNDEVVDVEPVVEEPEENVYSSSKNDESEDIEITEVTEDESKLPVIIEDTAEEQEDQTEVIQVVNMESEEYIEAEVVSSNEPEKSEVVEVVNSAVKSHNVITLSKSESDNDQSEVKEQDVQGEVSKNDKMDPESDEVVKPVEENILKHTKKDTAAKNQLDSRVKKIGVSQEAFEEAEGSILLPGPSDNADELVKSQTVPKDIEPTNPEVEVVQNKIEIHQGEAIKETFNKEIEEISNKKDFPEGANESVIAINDQKVAEKTEVTCKSTFQSEKSQELQQSMDMKDDDLGQNVDETLKDIVNPSHNKIEKEHKFITENKDEKIIEEVPIKDAKTSETLITVNLCEQEEIDQKSTKEDISFISKDTDSETRKDIMNLESYTKHEEVKPTPEINIRRKTVEQDLEKVVCLSEESSDSDTNEQVLKNFPKSTGDNKDSDCEQDALIHDVPMVDDLPPNQEESDLIEIAREVEQLQNEEPNEPEIPSAENMPGIEEILSDRSPEMPVEIPVDSGVNLETILAVASLQNEPVHEIKVERRLSDKELREMEAIRMAVASITDSSQDTYDSFLVESSMTMESSIQEFPNDIQELSSDTQELSNDVQELSDDTQNLPELQIKDVIGSGEVIVNPADTVIPNVNLEKEDKNTTKEDRNVAPIKASDVSPNETDKSELHQVVPDVSDVKASDNLAEAARSSDTVGSSKELADVTRQSKATLPELIVKDNVDLVSDQDKDKVSLTKQIEHIKDKKAPEFEHVAESKASKSEQDLNKKEITASNNFAEENNISTPEKNDEKESTTAEPLVKVYRSENAVEEQDVSAPEPKVVVEKEAISAAIIKEGQITSEQVQKEIISEPDLAKEPKISILKSVEKKDILIPKKVEERNVRAPNQVVEEKVLAASRVIEEAPLQVEERSVRNRTKRGNKVSEPLSISVDDIERKEKPYSPKITIKPVKVPDEEVSTTSDAEGNKGSLKITITKQSDKMHSILKVYNPEDDSEPPATQEEPIPKLIIKPKMQQVEPLHSPKMSTRSSRVYSPTSTQRCSSPRVTIKPVLKPLETKTEPVSPLKITFKPVVKPDEGGKKHSPKTSKEQDQKNHNPKIIIKPIPKPAESEKDETPILTPKVTIKPIKRHSEDIEGDNEQERSSPKITIKPVVKPTDQDTDHTNQIMPKLKIKPIKKHEDEENSVAEKDRDSPKISIKPILKPPDIEEDEEVKERIVLKINKGNLPTPSKDSRKREYPEDEKIEKMGKLKLKFSTMGGQTHIVQDVEDGCKRQRKDSGYSGKKDTEESSNKRMLEEKLPEKNKKLRSSVTPDKGNEDCTGEVGILSQKLDSPIVISEDSRSQHSADCVILDDFQSNSSDISKIADIASRTTHIEATPVMTVGVVTPSVSPAPKKRGRPRKVPLEVREEFKDAPVTPHVTPQITPFSTPVAETSGTFSDKSEPGTPITTPSPGGRPKRSCRGQNVIATLGIKPRKPRGRGSGRGGKVNMGDREPVLQAPVEPVQTVSMKPDKEPKLTKAKLKLIQKAADEEAKRQKDEVDKQGEDEAAERARQIEKGKEKRQEEEQALKKQEEEELQKRNLALEQTQEEERHKNQNEDQEKQLELAQQHRQKALQKERKRAAIELEEEKKQTPIDEVKQLELQEQGEIHEKYKEEALKSKKEEVEGQVPSKKKKEDKTPPRKLEVTTRRQKAQLQKAAEEARRAAAEAQRAAEAKKSVENPNNSNPKKVATVHSEISASTSASDIIIVTDEDSLESQNTVEGDKPKEKGKKTPEQKGKGKTTPEKTRKLLEKTRLEEEKTEEARQAEELKKVEEHKKAELEKKVAEEKKALEEKRVAEEKEVLEKKKAAEEYKALEDKRAAEAKKVEEENIAAEEKRAAEKRAVEEKQAAEERKALEEKKTELLKKSQEETKAEETADDRKPKEASAEEEESEDSEIERQRELFKQKKQEAIKKCRAKRMEKLAKAAEMKRKRQETAAQQRAARLAAEEAERIAAEKARVNRRYGRYGTPKPQISLIDEPVRETEGTIKSHMGLFNPQTEQLNIIQPIAVDDDSDFAGSQQGVEKPLKQPEVSAPSQKLLAPPTPEPMAVDSIEDTPTKTRRPMGSEDVMMVDEDTRMSADLKVSRSQTPAKHSIPLPDTMVEDSQGSLGTESVGSKSKNSKTPKMEVFQDLESTHVTAEHVAEYSWSGRGPFMIQEQVALFLGIKSFKRKYPNCQRRTVEMQERDYLKENGFVTEAQCDLGLTAVNAQDILDIMYADFQDKYEDYCKVQREKQAAELANKQKALSQFNFKPGYEKLDILEQAVQSAAAWNQQFNKSRREERKAHMDLQNMTVHYPKLKTKVIPTPKIGDHPIALVPGQFTDYYKEFTPTELNNLPLNTMCYDEIKVPGMDSESDESSSGSDSDSDSSSDSSSSDDSCDEDCKECDKRGSNNEVNGNDGNEVTMDNNGSNDSVVLVTAPASVSA